MEFLHRHRVVAACSGLTFDQVLDLSIRLNRKRDADMAEVKRALLREFLENEWWVWYTGENFC